MELNGISGRPATAQFPAVVLNQVEDATIRNTKVEPGTTVFLDVKSDKTRGVGLVANDLRKGKIPYRISLEVRKTEVAAVDNLGGAK